MLLDLQKAKDLLKSGSVVAIPTETVYGLAALADNEKAVQSIFTLKGRPSHNPLILHIGDHEQCLQYASSKPKGLESLMSAFWPGPLTLVVPVHQSLVLPSVRANLPTAAFRMPNHPLTLELLKNCSPLVAPSANLSGSPSATKPEHVENDFGKNFPILDGGPCEHGVESTILISHQDSWQIARLGALSQEALAQVLGYLPSLATANNDAPICPGQLLAHYAPKARLTLSTKRPHQKEVVLGFTNRTYEHATKLFLLGNLENPETIAHKLYHTLRQLDLEGIPNAWVDIDFADRGLLKTIKERLIRAANQ